MPYGRPRYFHLQQAALAAAAYDVAVVLVGLDAGEEHESGDRNQTGAGLRLPGSQEALVEAVVRANPLTVVVSAASEHCGIYRKPSHCIVI